MKILKYSYIGYYSKLVRFEYYEKNIKKNIVETFYGKTFSEALEKCLVTNNIDDRGISITYIQEEPNLPIRLDYTDIQNGYLVKLYVNNKYVPMPFKKFLMQSVTDVGYTFCEIFGVVPTQIELREA